MPSAESTLKDHKQYDIESDLYKAVRSRLTALGARVLKIHGDPMQERAVDLIVCYRSKYISIELKARGKKLTEKQEQFLTQVRAAGGIGIGAWSVADCLSVIQEIDEDIARSGWAKEVL